MPVSIFRVNFADVESESPEEPVVMAVVNCLQNLNVPEEAQSVVERDGYVYAGVWGTSEIVTVDVRNPWKSAIKSARAARRLRRWC